MTSKTYICPLCEREVVEFSDHHLVPQSRGGRNGEKVLICQDCHSTIHKFYDNKRLERELNSVDALLAEEKFARHIAWLKKRPGSQRFKTHRARDRRKGKYS